MQVPNLDSSLANAAAIIEIEISISIAFHAQLLGISRKTRGNNARLTFTFEHDFNVQT
jgi:hypothetical protein